MEWVKTVHWIAVFLAFLGPLLATGITFEWLVNLMLLLGIVVALATYGTGIPGDAATYLLLAALAIVVLPSPAAGGALVDYIKGVVVLGTWYALPLAIAQGWKSLVG